MNDYDDIFCGSLALLGKNWVQLIPGGLRSVAPSYPLTGTVSLGRADRRQRGRGSLSNEPCSVLT